MESEKKATEIEQDKIRETFYRCLEVFDEWDLSNEEVERVCDTIKIALQIECGTLGKEMQKRTRLLKMQLYTAIASTAAVIISLISLICKIVR